MMFCQHVLMHVYTYVCAQHGPMVHLRDGRLHGTFWLVIASRFACHTVLSITTIPTVVLLSPLQLVMGSVGEDYRCPFCGRTGMGGCRYLHEGPIGNLYARPSRPICTGGEFSCLWYQLREMDRSPTEVRALALSAACCHIVPFNYAACACRHLVVSFLYGDE